MLIGLWFCSPELMTPSMRGKVYRFLELVHHWSLIDIFMLVTQIVAFSLCIGVGGADDPLQVYIYVLPTWGIFAFSIGVLMLFAMVQSGIAYNRKLFEPKVDRSIPANAARSSLQSHHYKIGGKKYRFTTAGKVSVYVLLLATVITIVLGAALETFFFEFGGIAGDLMTPENKSTNYSLLSLVSKVEDAAQVLTGKQKARLFAPAAW